MREGAVVALCTNLSPELQKHPCDTVVVEPYGFGGDRHAGPTRRNHSTGEEELNDRQISVVAKEVVDELAAKLGVEIPVGGLGENILVEGLGDLSDLHEGEYLLFPRGVVLRVTGQNDPCVKINVYSRYVAREIYGRRGITAIVCSTGFLKVGDRVVVS